MKRAWRILRTVPRFLFWMARALKFSLGGRGRFTQLAKEVHRQRVALDSFREQNR